MTDQYNENFFTSNNEINSEQNCFLRGSSENIFQKELDCLFDKNPEESFIQIRKRINDFDSRLILENAQNTMNNQSLKIELKISSTEKEFQKVDDQIRLLELLNLDYDKERLADLYKTKKIIEKQITSLKDEYKKMGLIYRISDDISELVSACTSVASKGFLNDGRKKLEKFLPFMKKTYELNSEIQKLKLLHKKLSEKSNHSTPFGENEEEIKTFVAFWSKAKQIDAKINKIVKNKNNLNTH
ncbi:MAG: hypothetical protein WC197_04350 [Candidatus Gastranaerophilaceae bacterium]